jgi:hypothetical protein
MGVPHLLFVSGSRIGSVPVPYEQSARQELNSVGNAGCRRSSVPDQAESDNRVGPFDKTGTNTD